MSRLSYEKYGTHRIEIRRQSKFYQECVEQAGSLQISNILILSLKKALRQGPSFVEAMSKTNL